MSVESLMDTGDRQPDGRTIEGAGQPGDLPFRWRGGHLALDFANTVGWAIDETTGRSEVQLPQYERLTRYARLVAWAREAGVLPEREARRVLTSAAEQPDAAEEALQQALVLRLAIHRLLSAVAQGEPVDRPALAVVNGMLPAAHAGARLRADEDGFGWDWDECAVSLGRPIWPVVVAASQLVIPESLRLVGECRGEDCGWLFLDTSPSGDRQWCSDDDCGVR